MRMMRGLRGVAMVLLLVIAPASRSQGERGDALEDRGEARPVELVVRSARIERFLGDRVELAADIELTPGVAATVEDVRFRGMKLDGRTPVYLEAVGGKFALQRGIPLALPPVTMSVYYSDFPSPSSMEAILDAHAVRVTGEVRASLRLSLLGKLATRDLHPTAALRIDQDVPLEQHAVDTPTQVGIGVLSLAQNLLGVTATVLDRVAGVRVTSEDGVPEQRETRPIVVVRTSYRLQGKEGGETRSCVRLGFWVDEHHVLAPAEVLEPWMYSVDAAMGAAKVDESSVETTVSRAAAQNGAEGTGWSRARGDFVVVRQGSPDHVRLSLPTGNTVSVMERESAGNYAVLEFPRANGIPVARQVSAGGRTLHAVRLKQENGATIRSFELGPQVDGEASRMPRPVDALAFGSPMMLDYGTIGMVVGERTVVPLSTAGFAAR